MKVSYLGSNRGEKWISSQHSNFLRYTCSQWAGPSCSCNTEQCCVTSQSLQLQRVKGYGLKTYQPSCRVGDSRLVFFLSWDYLTLTPLQIMLFVHSQQQELEKSTMGVWHLPAAHIRLGSSPSSSGAVGPVGGSEPDPCSLLGRFLSSRKLGVRRWGRRGRQWVFVPQNDLPAGLYWQQVQGLQQATSGCHLHI